MSAYFYYWSCNRYLPLMMDGGCIRGRAPAAHPPVYIVRYRNQCIQW